MLQIYSGINILSPTYHVWQGTTPKQVCKQYCRCDLFEIMPQLNSKDPSGA